MLNFNIFAGKLVHTSIFISYLFKTFSCKIWGRICCICLFLTNIFCSTWCLPFWSNRKFFIYLHINICVYIILNIYIHISFSLSIHLRMDTWLIPYLGDSEQHCYTEQVVGISLSINSFRYMPNNRIADSYGKFTSNFLR